MSRVILPHRRQRQTPLRRSKTFSWPLFFDTTIFTRGRPAVPRAYISGPRQFYEYNVFGFFSSPSLLLSERAWVNTSTRHNEKSKNDFSASSRQRSEIYLIYIKKTIRYPCIIIHERNVYTGIYISYAYSCFGTVIFHSIENYRSTRENAIFQISLQNGSLPHTSNLFTNRRPRYAGQRIRFYLHFIYSRII